MASHESFSHAARPNWAPGEIKAAAVIGDVTIETMSMSVQLLFAQVQYVLSMLPFNWFYPSPVIIYARSQDGQLYCSILGEFKTRDDVTLHVRLHKGQVAQLHELAEAIRSSVA